MPTSVSEPLDQMSEPGAQRIEKDGTREMRREHPNQPCARVGDGDAGIVRSDVHAYYGEAGAASQHGATARTKVGLVRIEPSSGESPTVICNMAAPKSSNVQENSGATSGSRMKCVSTVPPNQGAQSVDGNTRSSNTKCAYAKCKNNIKQTQFFPCSISACGKNVHSMCYSALLVEVGMLGYSDAGYVCGRRCLKKLRKQIAESHRAKSARKRRVLWSQDGSLAVLLNWLTKEGNYGRYVGGSGADGRTKDSYQKEIKCLLEQTEGCSVRSEKDIASKIANLEKSFRDATDWLNSTGRFLSDPVDIKNYVRKTWPYHYQLEPIMAERLKTRAVNTNEDSAHDVDECDIADLADGRRDNMNTQRRLLRGGTGNALLHMEQLNNPHKEYEQQSAIHNGTPRRLEGLLLESQVEEHDKPENREGKTGGDSQTHGSSCSARQRLLLCSESTGKKDRKKARHARCEADEPFGLSRDSQHLALRRNEVQLRREEIDSRKKVDSATLVKLKAEASFADARAHRERQQASFERLKQIMELQKMGFTKAEIEKALGSFELASVCP